MSQGFMDHLNKYEIVSHRTPLYTPQHNGVPERRNQSLLDMVQSMMNQTTLPMSFWDYAIESDVRILNMLPTKKDEKTPLNMAWESPYFVLLNEASGSYEDFEEIQDEDMYPSENTSKHYDEVEHVTIEPQCDVIPIRRGSCEPANYKAALSYPKYDKWLKAMNAKIQSMKDNEVWSLVDVPPNVKTIRSKKLFKKKTGMDDNNQTSRFQQNPRECDWTVVKIILKYLRNNKDMFLVYGGNIEGELRVTYYTIVGYETDADDSKSQIGYVFILNEGTVYWKSAKQSITAMSSTEAEYIAGSQAAMEAVWISKFINGLGVVSTNKEPLEMYYDNYGALIIANEHG
ncbi:retrotransposon protein, putative, ty1-copia subclass, partial [Tanacetum coccineum]